MSLHAMATTTDFTDAKYCFRTAYSIYRQWQWAWSKHKPILCEWVLKLFKGHLLINDDLGLKKQYFFGLWYLQKASLYW